MKRPVDWKLFAIGALCLSLGLPLGLIAWFLYAAADSMTPTTAPSSVAAAESIPVSQYFMKDDHLACADRADLEMIYKLIFDDKDQVAADRYRASHDCVRLVKGETVFLEDTALLHGSSCVRKRGQSKCVWVDMTAIVKTKPIEAPDADAASIAKSFNDEFDRQHPECKDYKTNPHLPKDCY